MCGVPARPNCTLKEARGQLPGPANTIWKVTHLNPTPSSSLAVEFSGLLPLFTLCAPQPTPKPNTPHPRHVSPRRKRPSKNETPQVTHTVVGHTHAQAPAPAAAPGAGVVGLMHARHGASTRPGQPRTPEFGGRCPAAVGFLTLHQQPSTRWVLVCDCWRSEGGGGTVRPTWLSRLLLLGQTTLHTTLPI